MTVVIIHGPLTSFGIGPNRSVRGFNCASTIQENVINAQRYGYKPLVSISYSTIPLNSENNLSENEKENLNIEFTESTTIYFDTKDIIEPDNRNKQRLGILNALNQVKSHSSNQMVLIIRTDMLMPLSFWEWYKQIELDEFFFGRGGIICSELSSELFYLGDFVLAGKNVRLSEIFQNLTARTNSSPFHPISNCELGYSVALGDFSNFRKLSYFWHYNHLRECWLNFSSSVGTPPREIYARIRWRGLGLENILDLSDFSFKTHNQPMCAQNRFFQNILSLNHHNARLDKALRRHISMAIILEKFIHQIRKTSLSRSKR